MSWSRRPEWLLFLGSRSSFSALFVISMLTCLVMKSRLLCRGCLSDRRCRAQLNCVVCRGAGSYWGGAAVRHNASLCHSRFREPLLVQCFYGMAILPVVAVVAIKRYPAHTPVSVTLQLKKTNAMPRDDIKQYSLYTFWESSIYRIPMRHIS